MTVPDAAPVDGPDIATGDAADQQADEQQADEQARAEARLRLRHGRLVTAVVLAVVLALVGAVALLGGFRMRQDRFTTVPVGTLITTGPFEVTVTKATVQHGAYDKGWRVEVSGTARTTGGSSITPETGDSGFVFARAGATREVQASSSITVGPRDPGFEIIYLAPGLPAVPWTLYFTFTQPPGDELLVVVFDQEYTTPWIFGDEMGWRPTRNGTRMTLPLETLAR